MAKKDLDLGRLCRVVNRDRLALQRYRTERLGAVRQYAGGHYSDDGSKKDVPVNFLSLYLRIVSRGLIAKAPRVMLSTFQRPLKPIVSAMQAWANQQIEKMLLAMTLRRVVVDALFSVGICKVALANPADTAKVGWSIDAGSAFCERVDLDDFVFDLRARDFSEASYIGHRIRVPLDAVRDSKLYSKARKDLKASQNSPINPEGDDKINTIGRGYFENAEDVEDMVDLWEIYLPRHGCVYTFADDDVAGGIHGSGVDEALRYQEWVGPASGPYKMLGLHIVPGNAMPKGPILDLIDLHVNANQVMRKLLRQAQRQKEVLGVRSGATEDGARTLETSDGEAFRCDNPDAIKLMSFGGPNQQNFALFMALKDLFDFFGGNLSIMGGLGPQSRTATQDKMLNENSSAGMADMQETTLTFVADVLKSLGWYWWHDPYQVMRTTHAIPGLPQISIERQVTPEQRLEGRYEDVDMRVDPYSIAPQTPQSRLRTIISLLKELYFPIAPLAMQAGVMLDPQALLRKAGELADEPGLADVLTIQEAPRTESASSPTSSAGMPAATERTYVRENVPGRTQKGNDMNLMNSLMGVDPGGASDAQAA